MKYLPQKIKIKGKKSSLSYLVFAHSLESNSHLDPFSFSLHIPGSHVFPAAPCRWTSTLGLLHPIQNPVYWPDLCLLRLTWF